MLFQFASTFMFESQNWLGLFKLTGACTAKALCLSFICSLKYRYVCYCTNNVSFLSTVYVIKRTKYKIMVRTNS